MVGFGRGRARSGMAVLAALALAALVGCGGDGDKDFDFDGTWLVHEVVTRSNVAGFPVGMRGTDVARITQSGKDIEVTIEGVAPMAGECDLPLGTFAVVDKVDPLLGQMNGAKIDEDSASGVLSLGDASQQVRFAFTMERLVRDRAAVAAPPGGPLAAALSAPR